MDEMRLCEQQNVHSGNNLLCGNCAEMIQQLLAVQEPTGTREPDETSWLQLSTKYPHYYREGAQMRSTKSLDLESQRVMVDENKCAGGCSISKQYLMSLPKAISHCPSRGGLRRHLAYNRSHHAARANCDLPESVGDRIQHPPNRLHPPMRPVRNPRQRSS